MMLVSKKTIYSLLFLIICFFSLAGHYIMLNAQFLAVVHIIVYAGAIMVLFLFTLMLLNLNLNEYIPKKKIMVVASVISGCIMFVVLLASLRTYGLDIPTELQISQIGLVKNLGKVLFDQYLFPFELSSFLFLTAMVGAISIAKK